MTGSYPVQLERAPAARHRRPSPSVTTFNAVRLTVATALTFAATSKLLGADIRMTGGAGTSGPEGLPLFLLVAFELLLAMTALAPGLTKAWWWFATSTFALFTVVSTRRHLQHLSCGCFGALPVPSLAIVTFDLAVFVALIVHVGLIVRGPSRKLTVPIAPGIALLSLAALTASLLNGRAAGFTPVEVRRTAEESSAKQTSEALGRYKSLLDNDDELKRATAMGRWIVMVYSNACVHCQNELDARLQQLDAVGKEREFSLAVVELPPTWHRVTKLLEGRDHVFHHLVSSRAAWPYPTPASFIVVDGVIGLPSK